jgi:hypothetical protein
MRGFEIFLSYFKEGFFRERMFYSVVKYGKERQERMNIIERLLKRFYMRLFVHKIGRLSRRYEDFNNQTEKAAFAMQEFGTAWKEAIERRDHPAFHS